MTATLPQVIANLRTAHADWSETELVMAAAALIVTYEWQQAGRLPATHLEMWPDVQLLLTQYGYKVGA